MTKHVCVCVLQGKQIQHSPHALPLRQGTRRRQGMTNQPPQQQQQQQYQQQQQQQFQAQPSIQQQGSISRLSSDNLINSNTVNMNGAALLTGLGDSSSPLSMGTVHGKICHVGPRDQQSGLWLRWSHFNPRPWAIPEMQTVDYTSLVFVLVSASVHHGSLPHSSLGGG